METVELYCTEGTCLCIQFRQESNDPGKCECGHLKRAHEENVDDAG